MTLLEPSVFYAAIISIICYIVFPLPIYYILLYFIGSLLVVFPLMAYLYFRDEKSGNAVVHNPTEQENNVSK